MKIRTMLAGFTLAGAALSIPVAANASASHATSLSCGGITPAAVTALHYRPDSGNNGYWALDDFSRLTSYRLTGRTGNLYDYTVTLCDSGAFYARAGAYTPNQSSPGEVITGRADGVMTGTDSFTITTASPVSTTPNAGIPAAIYGSAYPTSTWYENGFPAVASVTQGPWSWDYQVTSFPAIGQHWTDAWNNNYGDNPGDGNISG